MKWNTTKLWNKTAQITKVGYKIPIVITQMENKIKKTIVIFQMENLLSTINTDIWHQIENIVYLELKRRGYRVNLRKWLLQE